MRPFLVCLFILGCATSQNGKAQADLITHKIENAKRVLADPKATPAQKREAGRELDEAAKAARSLGKAHDKEQTRAEKNEEKADKYNAIMCGAGYLSFLLIAAGFILWRLKPRPTS